MPQHILLDPYHPVVTRVMLIPSAAAVAAGVAVLATHRGWWSLLLVTAGLALLNQMLQRRTMLRLLTHAALTATALVPFFDRFARHHTWHQHVLDMALVAVAAILVGLAVWIYRPVRSIARRISGSGPGAGRSFAVILNPAKVESVGAFQFLVHELADETGWARPTWHFTTPEETGASFARQAHASGADLVLVCGGDGTVRDVCAALADSGVTVGIVPAGTGNLLARNLHLPLYTRAAIDVALTGRDQAIDLVAVSGDHLEPTHSMVMAGMGLDAAIMEGVDDEVKRHVGWLAYVVSGAQALTYPPMKLEISIDGGPFTEHRARTVVVGNAGSLQGGVQLLPDARLDDGLLDIVLLYPQRLTSWVPVAMRVLTRARSSDELITRFQGRSVTIRTDHDVPRQLDGDLIAGGRELTLTCQPRRVLVRVAR